MPIPNYQSIMLPLLRLAADDKVHRVRDAVDHLEQHFGLSVEEKRELMPDGRHSGKPTTIDSKLLQRFDELHAPSAKEAP